MAEMLETVFASRLFDKAMAEIPKELNKSMRNRLGKIGSLFEGKMAKEQFVGYSSSSRPSKLMRRSGQLARSFRHRVVGKSSLDMELVEFTTSPYAAIQEEGGTVKPKTTKYLAIPLQAALTKAGVSRKSPRQYEDTFFAHSKHGNLILFQKRKSKIVPLFVLKKEVKIPARLGAERLFKSEMPVYIEVINDGVYSVLKQVVGGGEN